MKFGRPRKALPEGFGEVKARWERGELSARAAGRLLGVTHRSFLLWAQDDGCKEIVKKERTVAKKVQVADHSDIHKILYIYHSTPPTE